jgi:hypothetical protein
MMLEWAPPKKSTRVFSWGLQSGAFPQVFANFGYGITHVLSVAAEGEPQFWCTEGIVYLQHPIIIEVNCQLHNDGAAMLKDILPS